MANNINIVITAEDKASKPIRSISDEMDGASGKSSKFKSALGSLGGVLKTTAIAGGIAAAAFVGTGAALGFSFNNSVEQAQTKLLAFMQDGDKVAKTLSWVKKEAALTQFSFTDLANATANLVPMANSSGIALEDLVKQAEILASVNPEQGLMGGMFALREALSGDWVSIVDRFNLPRKRINELKAQGVPAMEIISRTLGEMGINYDLVAKQGKTTAARFEQVKDKLVMMAGAASKPIFDRVSSELGKLGEFNFEALGDQLGGIASGSIAAFDSFIPKVQEVARQIGDYLGPKIDALWQSVNTNLVPILEDLWHNVIEPLIPVLGTLLVGALGLVIDAFKFVSDGIGWLVEGIEGGNPVIWGLVGLFGTLATAMAFNAVFNALTVGFATFQLVTIPSMMTSLGLLKAAILAPIVMPAIVIAAALASMGLILDAANKAKDAIDNASRAKQKASDDDIRVIKNVNDRYNRGEITLEKKKQLLKIVSSNAAGTNSDRGGWSLVGEHGPEIVNLPTGAGVTPAYQTRAQGSPGASGHTVLVENININNGGDYHRMLNDIGFALELAS
ncbi:hypothetical protein E3O62_02455 [Cryobacterium sp. TMT2-15-1]|uniref:hypothetical protein n=1 Tax=Cryobacterium sp. TMT2-15-1 TaxID=1259246 RepID=UPI00106A6BE8|nr:hypothetical protein [Cryobacterium sp. TMT2-15-1]TFC63708.1 hypothetical protein E3O62_02455 [Cryobacterium sp. TMT2-15-1]